MKTVHPYFLILGKLTKQGVRYGVVGQMGASFYGSDQTTYDLDIFVEPREKNLSKLRRLLKKEGLVEMPISQGQAVKPAPTSQEVNLNRIFSASIPPVCSKTATWIAQILPV